jgi:DNA-binding beta-propeller fold protein YncE
VPAWPTLDSSLVVAVQIKPAGFAHGLPNGRLRRSFPVADDRALEPTGKFAYVSDYVEGDGKVGKLSAYEIESGGVLKQVKGSPFVVERNAHPTGVAIDPSGAFVYLTDSA